MRKSDFAIILLVIVTVFAAVVADRAIDAKVSPSPQSEGNFVSNGWYCPAPEAEGSEAFMATTNLGRDPVRLRRETAGAQRASDPVEGDLLPRRRSTVKLGDFGIPEAVGVAEAFGAATTTDLLLLSRGGVAASRCSVQPSNRWLFAYGSTGRGRNTYLLVANPFREESVVKVRFMTTEDDETPARLRDFVVQPLSQGTIFLSDYFPETESFGLEVTAVRGRVVMSRYLQVATRDGIKGISLDPGVRDPSPQWYFAGGELPAEGEEFLELVNPGEKEALLQVFFATDAEQLSPPNLQEVPLPAGRHRVINVADFLPRGTRHSTSVIATNDVPIIAERLLVAPAPGGRGTDVTFGAGAPAKRWALSVGAPIQAINELSILNPRGVLAFVRVALITEKGEVRPSELSALRIDSGRRLLVDVSPFLSEGTATAVVEAVNGEIVVERRVAIGPPYSDFADSFGQPFE